MTLERVYDRESIIGFLEKRNSFVSVSEVAGFLGCTQKTAKDYLFELQEKLEKDSESKITIESIKAPWKGRSGYRWEFKLKEKEE